MEEMLEDELIPVQALMMGSQALASLEVPVEFLFKQAEGLPPQTALAADDSVPAEGETRPIKKPVDPTAPPSQDEITRLLEKEKKRRDEQNATDDPPQAPKPKS